MRISDWSSDVCSSDLRLRLGHTELCRFSPSGRYSQRQQQLCRQFGLWCQSSAGEAVTEGGSADRSRTAPGRGDDRWLYGEQGRKRGVEGTRVSRVDLGGRRTIKQKNNETMKLN